MIAPALPPVVASIDGRQRSPARVATSTASIRSRVNDKAFDTPKDSRKNKLNDMITSCALTASVPFAMEGIGFEVHRGKLLVGDFGAGGVAPGVLSRALIRNPWPVVVLPVSGLTTTWRLSSGRPRQFLGDVAEQAVLDLVPLAGAGRKVAHLRSQPEFVGQRLQLHFPQPQPGPLLPPASAVISRRLRAVDRADGPSRATSAECSPRRSSRCRGRCPH